MIPELEHNHVVCGDCLAVLPTWPDDTIDLVVTSPPYNIGLNYGPHVDDFRPWPIYYAWLKQLLHEVYRVLKRGGILALNLPKEVRLPTPERTLYGGKRVEKVATRAELIAEAVGFLPRETVVWVKGANGCPIATNYRMGSDNNIYLRATCELILLFSKQQYHINGGTGRRGAKYVPWLEESKDTWILQPRQGRHQHPAPFPEEIPRRLIDLFTCQSAKYTPLVADPCAGIGTVGQVARQLGRDFVGIEIEPEFAAMANAVLAASTLEGARYDLQPAA